MAKFRQIWSQWQWVQEFNIEVLSIGRIGWALSFFRWNAELIWFLFLLERVEFESEPKPIRKQSFDQILKVHNPGFFNLCPKENLSRKEQI